MKKAITAALIVAFVLGTSTTALAFTFKGVSGNPYRSGSYVRSYACTYEVYHQNVRYITVSGTLRKLDTAYRWIIIDRYSLTNYNFWTVSVGLKSYQPKAGFFYKTVSTHYAPGWSKITESDIVGL